LPALNEARRDLAAERSGLREALHQASKRLAAAQAAELQAKDEAARAERQAKIEAEFAALQELAALMDARTKQLGQDATEFGRRWANLSFLGVTTISERNQFKPAMNDALAVALAPSPFDVDPRPSRKQSFAQMVAGWRNHMIQRAA
jgi:hypothetical protein